MGSPGCSLVVRNCGAGDMESVERIERLSFRNPYPRWYLEFLRAVADKFFLVAELCGRVVGYAVAIPRVEAVCHLASIAVDPGYRGRGVGLALLQSIEHRCWEEGYQAIILEYEDGNEPAARMYRGAGYIELGVMADYYGPGRHAHLMAKPLHPAPEARDP